MKVLFTGRWIAFTIGSIVAFAILLGLAQWQWSSAESHRHAKTVQLAPIGQVVSLTQGVPADGPGRPVSVQGTYDAARQLRVTGQQVGSDSVDYVLTPIAQDDGVLVPVVRGYIPAGAPLPAPPVGPVSIVGALQASAYFSGTGPDVAAISTDNLTQRWNTRLLDGYVVLRTSTPTQSGITVLPASAIKVHHGLPVWRNIAYAAQWLIFAGFVAFFWFRASRDQIRTKTGAPSDQALSGVPSDPGAVDDTTSANDSTKQGEL
jgi:cytochrome oxidase assembly protein ShyY1